MLGEHSWTTLMITVRVNIIQISGCCETLSLSIPLKSALGHTSQNRWVAPRHKTHLKLGGLMEIPRTKCLCKPSKDVT